MVFLISCVALTLFSVSGSTYVPREMNFTEYVQNEGIRSPPIALLSATCDHFLMVQLFVGLLSKPEQ